MQPARLSSAGRRPRRRQVEPAEIARRIGSVVQWPGALQARERTWRLLAGTPDYDAWLIAWPSGGTVDLHDHGGSRGALHVVHGALVETMPWRDESGRLTLTRLEVPVGVTRAFGSGHVHDVRNEAPAHALSVHVYSPPLTSMLYYDCFEGRLVPREGARDRGPSEDLVERARTNRPALRLVAP